MKYESISNETIKQYKKLNTKKYRDSLNMFLVEGEHLVEEAIKAGVIKEIIMLEGVTNSFKEEVSYASKKVMNYLSELDSMCNIIGVCYKKIDSNIGDKIIALDGIQDPGNFGTIIRSSVAFNINTILTSQNTVDLYNSKTIRSSQGMLFYQNIISCDLEETLSDLKQKGYKIITTLKNSKKTLKDLEKSSKFVIIIGNEGKGVKENLIALADENITIKMNENCESLNAAIAASIVMYELNNKE